MEPLLETVNILDKDGFWVTQYISDGATSSNYDAFFIALYPCEVVAIGETHRVAGTNGGAVTLNIEKLTSGQALDAGSVLLTTEINLKGTANTPQLFSVNDKDFVFTNVRQLDVGDRLALKDTGTLTSVAGVQVTVYFKRLGKGHYQ